MGRKIKKKIAPRVMRFNRSQDEQDEEDEQDRPPVVKYKSSFHSVKNREVEIANCTVSSSSIESTESNNIRQLEDNLNRLRQHLGLVGPSNQLLSTTNEPEVVEQVSQRIEVDPIDSIPMELDAIDPLPMEVDVIETIPMESGELNEPQLVNDETPPQQVLQVLDANNLLRVRPIGARRLSESMPFPMIPIREETDEEIEKENRPSDEGKRV